MKVHGVIIIDKDGKPIMGHYGHVLLFKDADSARPDVPSGGKILPVITAKVTRKKLQPKPE